MKRQGKSLSYYLASAAGCAIGFAGIVSPFAFYEVVKANDIVYESARKIALSNDTGLMSATLKLPVKETAPSIDQSLSQSDKRPLAIEISDVSKLNVIDIPKDLSKPEAKLELNKEPIEKQFLEESPRDVDRFANRLRGGKKVKMVATAYCLNGRTASGVFSKYGIIAADPKYLPIGSIVRIRGGEYTGLYSVLDTGTKIKGRKIDIYLSSGKEAVQFGRRDITLEVLRYGWNPQICNDAVLEEQKSFSASIR